MDEAWSRSEPGNVHERYDASQRSLREPKAAFAKPFELADHQQLYPVYSKWSRGQEGMPRF
jgi:hypothetical protein